MKKALAVCLSLLLIFPMLPLSAGTDGGAVLAVGDPLPEPDGGEGRYRFPVWVEDAPGAVCGFMMTVTLTGGRIVGAEQGSDSFLTVTMCPITDGVRILLDGIPADGGMSGEGTSAGNPLLWLTVELSGGEDCTVTVSADSLLYYGDAHGSIRTCPAAGCRIDIPAHEPPSRTETRQATEPQDTQTEPCDTRTPPESASEPGAEQGTADPFPAPVLIGCRERITPDGLCVELLFSGGGAGEGCPAAWTETCPGGCAVTLSRRQADGFDCLRFDGLPTHGRVILTAADADGRLYAASYTDGAFTGWNAGNAFCEFVQK